eukprot:7068095-Karenia_brevis.AAC.1
MKLHQSQQILPGFLESHEQDGAHPLLLSDQAQAQMVLSRTCARVRCISKTTTTTWMYIVWKEVD